MIFAPAVLSLCDVLSRPLFLLACLVSLHILPLLLLHLVSFPPLNRMAEPDSTCSFKKQKKLILGVSCSLAILGAGVLVWFVTAESGPDLLAPPYFRLKELYEEPFSHGWGIDLPGYGPTLRYTQVQAHTLKPEDVPNDDGHMALVGGKIEFSAAGVGRCLEAEEAEELSVLNAPLCSDKKLQMWEVDVEGQVVLVGSSLCLTVGGNDTQREAGPWARRDLLLRRCQGGREQLWALVV